MRDLRVPIDRRLTPSQPRAPPSHGFCPGVRARVPPSIGVLEPIDDGHCVLTTGGDTYETVAALFVQAGGLISPCSNRRSWHSRFVTSRLDCCPGTAPETYELPPHRNEIASNDSVTYRN